MPKPNLKLRPYNASRSTDQREDKPTEDMYKKAREIHRSIHPDCLKEPGYNGNNEFEFTCGVRCNVKTGWRQAFYIREVSLKHLFN